MNTETVTLRVPAVAGRFYPANAAQLEEAVRTYLSGPIPDLPGEVRALITPHAGYLCSGEVAGAGFRSLRTRSSAEPIVYLLGPAHWKVVCGVGLSNAEAFRTPLGQVPVAAERVAELLTLDHSLHFDDQAHAPEHCLEVELPFLQVLFTSLRIVPMLLDDDANPVRLGGVLARILAEHPTDLVVVSSDLSHYHAYNEAVAIDYAFLKALAMGDMDLANVGEACGIVPILVLMEVAARLGWRPHLLSYANSGDTCGSRREVVGYGAVAYTAG